MNTTSRPRNKRWLAAAFFVLVLLLTVGPLALLRSPAPAGYANGIAVCEPEYNPGPAGTALADFDANYLEYRNQLEQVLIESGNPEATVIATLLRNRNDDESAISALRDLTVEYPQNAFLHLHYLSFCSEHANNENCAEDLIAEALELNRDNGAAWSLAAIYRDVRGDQFGSDQALRMAVRAPDYDDYYSRQVQYMLDVVPDLGEYGDTWIRYSLLAETPTLLLKNASQLSNLCGNAQPSREQLFQSCAEFGERMYLESHATIMNLVGSAIAEIGYRRLGDMENASRMAQVSEGYADSRRNPESDAEAFRSMGGLLTYDLNLSRFWMDAIVEFGEQGAVSATVSEARRRSNDPSYQPCVIR